MTWRNQPKFGQGPGQVAVLMARVAQFHQGKTLQFIEAAPAPGVRFETQLPAGAQHRFWPVLALLPGLVCGQRQTVGLSGWQLARAREQMLPQAGNGLGAVLPGQQLLAFGLGELAPVHQLQLDAGQIELAAHRHRDAAQVGREIGLKRKAVAVQRHGQAEQRHYPSQHRRGQTAML